MTPPEIFPLFMRCDLILRRTSNGKNVLDLVHEDKVVYSMDLPYLKPGENMGFEGFTIEWAIKGEEAGKIFARCRRDSMN